MKIVRKRWQNYQLIPQLPSIESKSREKVDSFHFLSYLNFNSTILEVKQVEKTIQLLESDRGIVQRVKGVFSFVNIVWVSFLLSFFFIFSFDAVQFLAIIGICIAVGPVLAVLAAPLVRLLVTFFSELDIQQNK